MNNIFHRGAEHGLYVGIYLILLSWMMLQGIEYGFMNLLSLVMLCLLPVMIFIMLRRTFVQEQGQSLLSGLWLEGIVSFICGSMIFALAAYAYLRWINPHFIVEQVSEAIKLYDQVDDEQAKEVVTVLKQIEKTRAYPTPQQIVLQLGLFITFAGSILSLLTASFLKIRGYRKR
ncbi:MAG: DUF4199 domain-containing protein [Muribaculaceae bacterium]|nr:DUF4199 domain-containing protein [Muribaculaceae bacterium]